MSVYATFVNLRGFVVVGAAAVLCAAPSALAIDLNTFDTFQDETVQNWLGGTAIANKPGGAAGQLDRYIQVDSNGNSGGAGSKLAFHNADTRWVGDYASAGVTGIQFDITNLNTTNLELRLVLFASGSRWTSTQTVSVPAGAPWRTVMIPISQSTLTRVLGNNTWAASIAGVDQIMIRHDPGTPSSGGVSVDATVGIDNIRVIPAPAAGSLFMLAGLGALRRSRRRGI